LRKSAQWVIGVLVSAVALWLAFRDVSLSAMADALRSANYLYLLPAIGFTFLGQVMRAKSWQTILGQRIAWRRVFGALNAGYLLNNLLPFRLGELGRAYLISLTQQVSTAQALSTVLIERVIDLCMIVGMLTAFVPLMIGVTGTPVAVVIAFLIPALALTVLFVMSRKPDWLLGLVRWGLSRLGRLWRDAHRLEDLFHAFVEGMAALKDGRRFFGAALWSGTAWLSAGISAWLLLTAFVPSATLSMGFFVLVVVGLGIAVPSAPGSIGVWQAAAVAALTAFKIDNSRALSFAIVNHLTNYGLTSVLGLLALAQEGESLAHLAQAARSLLAAKDDRR
jgi:uncharacterized protein (TIRG00374 family)